jgi:hypothetical protein
VAHHFKVLTLLTALSGIGIVFGCGSNKPSPDGVAEVPECRQSAKAVSATEFDSRSSVLRRRADAYSECMQAHGYVLDQDELDRMLLHKEQVSNSQPMGGDPAPFLESYRQELRMTPALWRPAKR